MTHHDAFDVIFRIVALMVAIGGPISMVTPSFGRYEKPKATRATPGKKKAATRRKSRQVAKHGKAKKRKPHVATEYEKIHFAVYQWGRDYGSATPQPNRMPL